MLKLVSNKELEVELAVKPSNREAGSTHAKCWHRWHRQCVCHRVLAAATSKPQVRLESKPAAVSDAALDDSGDGDFRPMRVQFRHTWEPIRLVSQDSGKILVLWGSLVTVSALIGDVSDEESHANPALQP